MKKQYYSKMKKRVGDGNQYKLEVTKCRKLMREAKDMREKSMVSRAGDSKDYLRNNRKKRYPSNSIRHYLMEMAKLLMMQKREIVNKHFCSVFFLEKSKVTCMNQVMMVKYFPAQW